MASERERTTGGRAARSVITGLMWGKMISSLLSSTLRLGVADVLGDGARTATEVAERCGTLPDTTLRLLRALAGLELLTEERPGVFRLTPAGALLRTDNPEGMSTLVRLYTDSVINGGWEQLDHSLRTGLPAFDEVFGHDYFTHLKENPDVSADFNRAMGQSTRLTAQVVTSHYDFSRFGTVVDVGGGDGTLVAGILRENPELRGVIYDTPEGLAQAPALLEDAGVAGRCALETGDFFASAPAGGDLYLLKSILHDWNDSQCAAILNGIRKVIPEGGRVLAVDPVLADVVDPATVRVQHYLSDLNMLVNAGGRERTEQDLRKLFADTGFTLTSITPLAEPSVLSLVEATPV
ncbi:methyltransferase [Streptomyces sp. AV19]|uniref:methyltransferase n=1 Tax=Streptomyces sp. AV19 TaxID=2793068 RepID=UPI0018FE51D9|nr:methyltransferase [Streptomyces sp. AV19]MBH1938576.1 methyltransferase [Streptomyces sp. AV19]MDG4533606.1 methyltransferase [Streptomyces sp. AV19]